MRSSQKQSTDKATACVKCPNWAGLVHSKSRVVVVVNILGTFWNHGGMTPTCTFPVSSKNSLHLIQSFSHAQLSDWDGLSVFAFHPSLWWCGCPSSLPNKSSDLISTQERCAPKFFWDDRGSCGSAMSCDVKCRRGVLDEKLPNLHHSWEPTGGGKARSRTSRSLFCHQLDGWDEGAGLLVQPTVIDVGTGSVTGFAIRKGHEWSWDHWLYGICMAFVVFFSQLFLAARCRRRNAAMTCPWVLRLRCHGSRLLNLSLRWWTSYNSVGWIG